MLRTIKLSNIPLFWIETDAPEEDIKSFVEYFEAIRVENGTMAPRNIQAKMDQRSEFIRQMQQQHNINLYARTELELILKRNERSAKWLYRQFKKEKPVNYETVTYWVNGLAIPQRENKKVINQITKALL